MNQFEKATESIKEQQAQGFVALGRSAGGYWWLREIMKVDGNPMTAVALLGSRMAVSLATEAMRDHAPINEFTG